MQATPPLDTHNDNLVSVCWKLYITRKVS